MASSTTSSHASGPVSAFSLPHSHKPQRILACVLCQHRKIKCDRNFPCANCIKAHVKCTPSTPAPARKRRRPNQDLQERLARCEELLKEYATEKPDHLTPRPAQTSIHEDPYKHFPAGKLVNEDGAMRFMDSPLLSVVYEELRAMRDIVDNDEPEASSPETMTPDNNSDLLLRGDSPGVKVETLWPDAAQIFRLWQFYLDRVNPLTKIIHVPSLQPYVAEAASGSQNVPKNIEALLFSVFLMAVVALTPDECLALLGYSREDAIQRFSSGVRSSLNRIGFLRSHDLTTLQALVIYLFSLQGRYNRHAAWILNGVAIRIAQKMGLHRDGEILGLPPFESEMRRRLWWQIILVDSKYAVFSGLSHSLLPRNCDTKPPKNVNDADIFPSATEPFQDREGPTEMIFCLMTYKFAKYLVENPGFESVVMMTEASGEPGKSGPTEEQLAEYRRGLEHLRQELVEILDKYCDPTAGPVHQMAMKMREQILEKLNEIINPANQQPEWGDEIKSEKDKAFKIAIGTIEHNEANYVSSKDQGFAWFSLLHFQLDIFMYMAGQLCHRTEGTLVERAWKQVTVVYSYHPELFDVTNKNYAALAVFILKAWKKRELVIFGRTGQLPEAPFYIEKLRACMPNEDYKNEPTPPNPYTPSSLHIGPNSTAIMPESTLDQFWNFLDPETVNWDMFSSPTTSVNGQMVADFSMFGGRSFV
ncbi:fungal-specific transcription factor domain-containing protein [Chaetomium strumarium]|uniref:Fungal-specific transcription factor domain-containing protein n=1 Tax=Chaetomium strumarium TaxID=1170767 RepID=A0AAJ0GYG5_9PEZI|nr:fungal-specific transcription factor domain-containing protein [Chaetomium strumarium]